MAGTRVDEEAQESICHLAVEAAEMLNSKTIQLENWPPAKFVHIQH